MWYVGKIGDSLCVDCYKMEKNSRTTGTRGGEKEMIYYYKIDEKNIFYQQISIFQQGTFPRIQDQMVKFQYEAKMLFNDGL